jgi:DNA-binding SARP family transcriptional activator
MSLGAVRLWHPLRERLWGHLMTAQCRGGRQADALATCQRLDRLLADELGIEPGAPVQQLHRDILSGRTAG